MPATETPLPPMHPWALNQMGMLLVMVKNARGGTYPFTTTPDELAGGMGAATASRVAQVLDDFDWRRALERENGVRLTWDGATLTVTKQTEEEVGG